MGVIDSAQYILRQQDLDKASELFRIDKMLLERLNSQRLLNTDRIRNILIRNDYARLTNELCQIKHRKNWRHKYPEVMRALQSEYGVTKRVLVGILEGETQSIHFCSRCGARISRKCHESTGGLCSNCYTDALEL